MGANSAAFRGTTKTPRDRRVAQGCWRQGVDYQQRYRNLVRQREGEIGMHRAGTLFKHLILISATLITIGIGCATIATKKGFFKSVKQGDRSEVDRLI